MILPSIWGGDSAFLPLPIKFGIEISAVCWSDLGVGRISGDPSDSSFPGMEVWSGFAEIDCNGLPEVNLKLAFFFSSSAFFRNVSTANASCLVRDLPGWWCLYNAIRFFRCCHRGARVWSPARLIDGWGSCSWRDRANILSTRLQFRFACSLARFAVELNLFRCRVASVSQLNYVTVITYYILEFESIFFFWEIFRVVSTLKHQSKKSTANHGQ